MRFTPVMTVIRPMPICSGDSGIHCCRILAPAMASTGTTSTQKYQYSQPTTNPAPSPRPARANSVNERTWGRAVAISPSMRMTSRIKQPADGVADEARGTAGDDRGAAAHEQSRADDSADRNHRQMPALERTAELVLRRGDRRVGVGWTIGSTFVSQLAILP